MLELLPDVEVYDKAVRYALEYDEFFDPKEIGSRQEAAEAGARSGRRS